MPGVEQLLADIDQASFLAHRALGRSSIVQVVWRYPGDLDREELEHFRRALTGTSLGRRVERSSVPCDRHHWVRADGPGPLVESADPIEPDRIGAWSAALSGVQVDPEHGPGWFLATVPLTDGGAALALVVSHTLGDGLAIVEAVQAVATGRSGGVGAPPPRGRVTLRHRLHDARVALGAVLPAVRGLAATVRLGRSERDAVPGSLWQSVRSRSVDGGEVIDVPAVLVGVPEAVWRERAEALGGSVLTGFAGLAVRMGAEFGRVGADGCVSLTFPINDRIEGDTRANALVPLTVRVRPEDIASDLGGLRHEIGRRLDDLRTHGSPTTVALAVTPFVPKALARRLEGVAAGSSATVGCSSSGVLDPAMVRPTGTQAVDCWVVDGQPLPEDHLRRIGGVLMLCSWTVNGRVAISVRGWQPGVATTQGELLDRVRKVFAELGLPADFH